MIRCLVTTVSTRVAKNNPSSNGSQENLHREIRTHFHGGRGLCCCNIAFYSETCSSCCINSFISFSCVNPISLCRPLWALRKIRRWPSWASQSGIICILPDKALEQCCPPKLVNKIQKKSAKTHRKRTTDAFRSALDAEIMGLYRDWEATRKSVHIEIVAVQSVNWFMNDNGLWRLRWDFKQREERC